MSAGARTAKAPLATWLRATTAPFIPDAGENARVDLARLGWLGITFVCLIAVLVLVLEGYYGYASVTFAVAVSAAINIT